MGPLGVKGQNSESGCGKIVIIGKWARDTQKEKRQVLRGFQKHSGSWSTFLQHRHVSFVCLPSAYHHHSHLAWTDCWFLLLFQGSASSWENRFHKRGSDKHQDVTKAGKWHHSPSLSDSNGEKIDWNPGRVLCGRKSIPFCSFWSAGKALSTAIDNQSGLSCQDLRLIKPPWHHATEAALTLTILL